MPLQDPLGGHRPSHGGAVRDLLRDRERKVGVATEQVERPGSRRLRDELRAEIRRPDRIRLGDGGGATILVPSDGEREPEGQDQADDAEQRALQDAERLAQRSRMLAQVHADEVTCDGRRTDHPEDDQRELPAVQAEEDALILTTAAAEPDLGNR